MKKLLVVAITLLSGLVINAQSKLYSTNEYGTSAKQIGKFEKDKIRTYKLENLDTYQII